MTSIFCLWAYLMKDILETNYEHWNRYLSFYYDQNKVQSLTDIGDHSRIWLSRLGTLLLKKKLTYCTFQICVCLQAYLMTRWRSLLNRTVLTKLDIYVFIRSVISQTRQLNVNLIQLPSFIVLFLISLTRTRAN